MKARTARSASSRLIQAMVSDVRALQVEFLARKGGRSLAAACKSLAVDLGREITAEDAADTLAQAVICAAPILRRRKSPAGLTWLRQSLSGWQQWVIQSAEELVGSATYSALSAEHVLDPAHLYELFLHRLAPTSRKRHGVFFTPEPIANYILREIDDLLLNRFQMPAGLASQSTIQNPQSTIVVLDPACGTGVFLLAVIDHLHRRLGERFNDFVPDLLARLVGIELLPVPAFLARLNVAMKLADTGYDFRQPGCLQIHVGDALSPEHQSKTQSVKGGPESRIVVVVGNPPFSSLTTNTNPWIARLVRGDEQVRGYVQAGDLRLGERKTWLHDDYVKFLRLAQWHVEQAGRGIVGMVTSRGYLDNATFRLMRHELLRVFPHIRVLDLHGSRKGGDVSPNGHRDENVFGLDQGVAITLLARGGSEASRIQYGELWGDRRGKVTALDEGRVPFCPLAPSAPHWRFVPTDEPSHPEYAAAWSLANAMPVHTPAPVTARDHFVVAFTADELHVRIAEFRDLAIPDDVIRQRYFTRTRSSRYPLGDTRSWKLAQARRAVAADAEWRSKIVRCLYRPFDRRYVFWHPAMIDWPRTDITRHLVHETGDRRQVTGNGSTLGPSPQPLAPLCLIARRQQLLGQPCTFFWICDGLALDGVIRSDNRGSESLFPLWLMDNDGSPRANFVPAFVERAATLLGGQPSPDDLLDYIYALFHSPTYRKRYAPQLRLDFPRVLLPGSAKLFGQLASLGRRLIDLHLLRRLDAQPNGMPEEPADFRVGGYVVLQKWLQPKHRSAGDAQYGSIASALSQTQRLMVEIDAAIVRQGGFPVAFAPAVQPPDISPVVQAPSTSRQALPVGFLSARSGGRRCGRTPS
jgi:hypothetical protein